MKLLLKTFFGICMHNRGNLGHKVRYSPPLCLYVYPAFTNIKRKSYLILKIFAPEYLYLIIKIFNKYLKIINKYIKIFNKYSIKI